MCGFSEPARPPADELIQLADGDRRERPGNLDVGHAAPDGAGCLLAGIQGEESCRASLAAKGESIKAISNHWYLPASLASQYHSEWLLPA